MDEDTAVRIEALEASRDWYRWQRAEERARCNLMADHVAELRDQLLRTDQQAAMARWHADAADRLLRACIDDLRRRAERIRELERPCPRCGATRGTLTLLPWGEVCG